jgi:V8-like Glu-specific endopeptidase
MYKLLILLVSLNLFAAQKTIYGTDSRVDYYEINSSEIEELAGSVAAMIPKRSMIVKADYSKFIAVNLGSDDYCEDTNFSNQTTIAQCTGFLISENKLLTTGSCIKRQSDCDNNNWVFNFKRNFKSHRVRTADAEDIFSCKKIIKRVNNRGRLVSYTIIELDRSTSRTPIDLATVEKPKVNGPIVMLGHPHGLPLKYSSMATSQYVYQTFFKADLDSETRSAGSPVFDKQTLKPIGMYLWGPNDYTTSNGCRTYVTRSNNSALEYIMMLDQVEL